LTVKKSQKHFKAHSKKLGEINGHIEEMFTGHVLVKAYNKQEGALEKFGLHLMIENMHAKTWAKGVLKSFLSEAVQEGSQQFAEEALMYRFRDQETAVDKAKHILESSLYGGILGSTATIAGRPVVLRHVKAVERKLLSCEVDGIDKQKAHELAYNAAFGNEKEQDAAVEEIQRIIALGEAKKAGFKEEYALKFAEKAVVPNSEIQDMIVTAANAELDPETYEGGSIESGVKFLDEKLKEINPVNEDFDIKERVKVAALENGASEEDAEFAGIATENFARVISNVTGETPREQWENGGKLTIGAQSETDRADWADIPVVPVDEKSAPDFENLIPVSEEDASALRETFDYNGESTSGQGTYVGEDGGIYLADGTLLFQDGKPESAKTREGGPEIAADDEVVEAVRIDENAMPEFKTKKELVEFIKEVLGKERNITVKSTKETVLVSNKGIERGATKTRSKKYNEAFASIKSLLENAKYSGFVEADERHPNVKGQDVYHSALIIGNQPYSVRFKVDIPKETGTHNYAGHGISEIKIASADDAGGLFRVPSGQNRDATYKISMGVLRGKVNPARFDPHNKTLYQSAKQPRGSIEITEAGYVIRLLKNSDPSTIVHELGHYFTIRYLDALQKAGKIDEAKGVFEWLGVSGVQEMQKEHYEKFARGFETYVMEGRSPNSTMQTLFTRFKNFLIGVYRDMVTGKIIKPEEINDETRAFFDKMLAVDDDFSLDMATVRGKSEALKKVVSEAMNGKEVTVDGMGLEQVADLFEMMNARIPRKPDTLIQMLRKAGGIDLKLAKMLDLPHLMGLQDAKGGAAGLFRKGGAIRQEDQLVEFLKEKGFISGDDSDYRGASELWENALRALENASQLYTSDGQMQMMRRTDLLEAAEMAAEILSGKNYDDVLNAVKTLRKKDVAAVSKDTLKYIKSKIKQIDSD